MRRFTLIAAIIGLAACAPPSPPPAAPPPAPHPATVVNQDDTATADQTLAELRRQPVTMFDFGLYRLRTELVPELEKSLRSQGLLRRTPAANNQDITKAGFVMIGVSQAKVEPYETLVDISVNLPATGATASPQTISELQQSGSRVVSAVRNYIGGPCAAADNPDTNKYASCSSAFYFYDWFEAPSVSAFNQPIAGRARAGYNLHSRVQVKTWGDLVGKRSVMVTCAGPVIREEVQCETIGE